MSPSKRKFPHKSLIYLILISQMILCLAPVASLLTEMKTDLQELSLEENLEFEEEDRKDKKREFNALYSAQLQNFISEKNLKYFMVFESIHLPDITTPPPKLLS